MPTTKQVPKTLSSPPNLKAAIYQKILGYLNEQRAWVTMNKMAADLYPHLVRPLAHNCVYVPTERLILAGWVSRHPHRNNLVQINSVGRREYFSAKNQLASSPQSPSSPS